MQRLSLFPPTLHHGAARDYQAEAEALNAEIGVTRDEVRRSRLIARRNQKLRNAEYHASLARVS